MMEQADELMSAVSVFKLDSDSQQKKRSGQAMMKPIKSAVSKSQATHAKVTNASDDWEAF